MYNILLPAGVISRIALQSLCHRYSDRNVSLSTLKSPSFRALVLLYCCIDIYVRNVMRMKVESLLRREFAISSHFLSSCLGLRVFGAKPNQSSRPGNSNTVITLSCKHWPTGTRQQNRENLQIQQDSNSTAVQV